MVSSNGNKSMQHNEAMQGDTRGINIGLSGDPDHVVQAIAEAAHNERPSKYNDSRQCVLNVPARMHCKSQNSQSESQAIARLIS